MDKSSALTAFSALGQSMRLDAFRLLIQAEPRGMAAGDIAQALSARQNTMSTNLATLQAAGLLRSERQGRSIRYFADLDGITGLMTFLMEDCCGGRPELCQPLLSALETAKETV